MTKEDAKYFSEILKAYSEGKTIQVQTKKGWEDLACEYANFSYSYGQYRIKPEPVFRPYASAEEFLQAQKEHGPYIYEKCTSTERYLNPVMVFNDHIIFWFSNNHINYTYLELLNKNYCWQDGHRCGILKETV